MAYDTDSAHLHPSPYWKYRHIQLDPKDRAIAEGLKVLITRDEDIAPGTMEECVGLGQILSEVIYILTYNWGIFVK